MNFINKKAIRKALSLMASVALGAGALTLAGCDDFLDEPVQGNSIDKDYYDTTYKLQTALNATYDILQSDAMTDTDWRFGEALAVRRCNRRFCGHFSRDRSFQVGS